MAVITQLVRSLVIAVMHEGALEAIVVTIWGLKQVTVSRLPLWILPYMKRPLSRVGLLPAAHIR